MNARQVLKHVLRATGVALVVVGFWACLRGLHITELRDIFAHALAWPLLVGTLLNFANMACKAASWQALLSPTFSVGVWRLFRYQIATSAVSAVTPMRAGEALRVWLLRDRDGVPVPHGAAVAVAEKILDAASMLLLIAPLPWLLNDLPAWVSRSVAIMCGGGALLAAVGIGLAKVVRTRDIPARWQPWLILLHYAPARVLAALVILAASWLADLGAVWLVLYAVGIDLPHAAGLLILLCVNLAIAVPSTPGQVGALELGAVAALTVLHVDNEQALAFALMYHAIQIVPLLLVALCDIRFVLGARAVPTA